MKYDEYEWWFGQVCGERHALCFDGVWHGSIMANLIQNMGLAGARRGRPRALLVYCSGSRATERLAEQIAARTGFDVDTIEHQAPPRGLIAHLRFRLRSLSSGLPPVSTRSSPAHYDLVVIGSPVQGRAPAAPVQAYLAQHAHELGDVALFCTTRARGAWETLRRMALLCGREPVAVLFATDREVEGARHRFDFDRFIDSIQEQLTAVPAYGRLTALSSMARAPAPVLAAAADAA
jgi:hypothetical protein